MILTHFIKVKLAFSCIKCDKISQKRRTMIYPNFFDKVDKIELYDALGEFLGAFKDGIVEIGYKDCVVLAGHSCPTVAGAYIATFNALKTLFEDETPIRGEIKVSMSNPKDEGVTGVIANVASFICGVADEGGFAGIGNKFVRRGKLSFGEGFDGDIKFTRLDNQKSVTLKIDTSVIKGNPEIMGLMQKFLQGLASESEKEEFASLWQDRVESMLLNRDSWDRIASII